MRLRRWKHSLPGLVYPSVLRSVHQIPWNGPVVMRAEMPPVGNQIRLRSKIRNITMESVVFGNVANRWSACLLRLVRTSQNSP